MLHKSKPNFPILLDFPLNAIWQEILVTQLVDADVFGMLVYNVFIHERWLVFSILGGGEVMGYSSRAVTQACEAGDCSLVVDDTRLVLLVGGD